MYREEFSKSVRLAAWARCGGLCECGCGQRIIGTPEYHHIVPASLGGPGTLDNCWVMARRCHRVWTAGPEGNPAIAKSTRVHEKRIGARTSRRGFRGWRKFSGEVVWK